MQIRTGVGRVALALVATFGGLACADKEQHWQAADARVPDVGVSFLETCSSDEQCASGKCLVLGAVRRCSRICDERTRCPALEPWRCSAGFCSCEPRPASDACNVDADCDGRPERSSVPEKCNGLDDDCNGIVDDVAPETEGAQRLFRDVDGDGFGDVRAEKWLCQAEAGYVADASDCDDARKEVNPAAVEVCGDALDNDCDNTLDDVDVCGLTPPRCSPGVPLEDTACTSGTLIDCEATPGVDASLDLDEIVFKQDDKQIKFTVRLVGMPATGACASYKLAFGDVTKPDDALVYVYRLPKGLCDAAGLPQLQAYHAGAPVTTNASVGFLAYSPGHVAWTIDKTEIFPRVPKPTYRVRACSNATADAAADVTACSADSCETRAHQ